MRHNTLKLKKLKISQNNSSNIRRNDQGIFLCRKDLLFCIFCLIIGSGLFVGCLNNMDGLYENYNSQFNYDVQNKTITPDDEEFDETQMLREEYFVYDNATLNISAPYNCASYSWSVIDMSTGFNLDVKPLPNYKMTGREFVTYIPDSEWKLGVTYKLTLKITNKEGVEYKDSCGIIVYQHYNYNLED